MGFFPITEYSAQNVIAVYSQREAANIAAQAVKSALATGSGATRQAKAQNTDATAKISLILEGISTTANSSPLAVAPTSPGSAGAPPVVQVPQPSKQTVDMLLFDVPYTLYTQGAMQSVSYTFSARQSIHQVAGGFYNDQFGLSPGSINFDLIVPIAGDMPTRVMAFKTFLEEAKLSNPLSPASPLQLRYVNEYDGMAFLLTQARLTMSYSADRQNMLIVSISADVLQDYNAPTLGAQQVAVAGVTSSATQVSTSTAILTQSPAVTSTVLSGNPTSGSTMLA